MVVAVILVVVMILVVATFEGVVDILLGEAVDSGTVF